MLLHVIAGNPRAVLLAARKARLEHPGLLAPMEHTRSGRAAPGMAVPV